MDTVDEYGGVTKVGCVVDLVLEENAGDLVGNEAWCLDGRGAGEVEVSVEGASLNSEHEITLRAVSLISPHGDFSKVSICAPRFSILASPITLPHILIA